jgi:hypothetical protein
MLLFIGKERDLSEVAFSYPAIFSIFDIRGLTLITNCSMAAAEHLFTDSLMGLYLVKSNPLVPSREGFLAQFTSVL